MEEGVEEEEMEVVSTKVYTLLHPMTLGQENSRNRTGSQH